MRCFVELNSSILYAGGRWNYMVTADAQHLECMLLACGCVVEEIFDVES